MRPIAVDLFAGVGGISLGFEQAGFDVLAAIDIDPIHCACYQYNFPFTKVLCNSVANVTGKSIRALSGIGETDIDVVFGGPPCQGFSLIGRRSPDDPRNDLIDKFAQVVIELKPKYFVMENVPALGNGKNGSILDEVITKFRRARYTVTEPTVLNAAAYCRWGLFGRLLSAETHHHMAQR